MIKWDQNCSALSSSQTLCIPLAVDSAFRSTCLQIQSPLLWFCSYKAALILSGFFLGPAAALKTNGGRNPLGYISGCFIRSCNSLKICSTYVHTVLFLAVNSAVYLFTSGNMTTHHAPLISVDVLYILCYSSMQIDWTQSTGKFSCASCMGIESLQSSYQFP